MSKAKRTSGKTETGVGSAQANASGPAESAWKDDEKRFPIVAIGASAGGLEAIQQLLKHLPARTGMAYVLVQHLDPSHESALTAILARATDMPVDEASQNAVIEPDHVYVIPPNKSLGIADRRLKLAPRGEDDADIHLPIDHFFGALAEAEGACAIGVVLSGSGSDGTQGLLAIKAAGGITLAQNEKSAKYAGMPANAIAAGCVDFVLPPKEMAAELVRVGDHPFVAADAAAPEESRPGPEAPDADEDAFHEILVLLRQHTDVDFTHYKHATLRRRIHRRMVLHRHETLPSYTKYLQGHPAEVKELYNDILIHVTGFFRDPPVFGCLKKRIFSHIVKDRSAGETLRLWVPGCSTGEEAYSLAIALLEFRNDRKLGQSVQIFGTDISEAALEKARAGLYPESIKGDVSAERLRRYFVKSERGYQINKSVREMCVFARQNVAVDPPFSKIDLISCRNVLIYLGPALQRKVLPLFHYALRADGFLVLGSSETVGGFAELFAAVDSKAKIYRKKAVQTRPAVTFGPGMSFGHETPDYRHEPRPSAGPSMADVQRQGDRIVLGHYSPPGVVINKHMEVLQFRGRTGPYLEHAHGEASLHLLKMAREGLVLDLRTTISSAMTTSTPVRHEGIFTKQDDETIELAIEVVPFTVPPSKEQFYLVLFEPAPAPPEPPARPGRSRAGPKGTESEETAKLREELAATRESLQAVIEEQEASNEELRSANEEIMSSNEELQSTSEEMETAKEELQSTNEELTTLNDELESRNAALEQVNNDLHNLMGSVNIPVVMVGPDLKIRRFTAIAEQTLNLIPTDVGRPITDIKLPVEVPDLPKVVANVMDSLRTEEFEIQSTQGPWWSVRVRPYKTTENKIDGAIIALLDIDVLKRNALETARSRAFAEAVIETTHEPLVALDGNLTVRFANHAFYEAFRAPPAETVGRRLYSLGNGQWNIPQLRSLLEEILPRNHSFNGFDVEHDFPDLGHKKMRLNARRLAYAEDNEEMILLAIEDVTEKT